MKFEFYFLEDIFYKKVDHKYPGEAMLLMALFCVCVWLVWSLYLQETNCNALADWNILFLLHIRIIVILKIQVDENISSSLIDNIVHDI